jgi:nitrogen-specific signal transduction histidine kinase
MNKEVSCINSRAIINYVKKNMGDLDYILKDLDPAIDILPDPESYLCDESNWISCAVASRLYERARLYFKDEMTAFHIARYAAENFHLGYGQRIIVKAFFTIKMGLKNLQRINDKWNRNKRIELVEIKSSSAIVRLHWTKGMDVSKDICLYNQGAYSYMPVIWGGFPIRVVEKGCYFSGNPYCEYHLSWSSKNNIRIFLSRFFSFRSVLNDTIKEMEKDKLIIEHKFEEVNRLNIDLNNRVKQLQAIQETGKAILSVLNLDDLLTVIMNTLSSVCNIQRALILLMNEQKGVLEYLHATGFEGELPETISRYRVPLDRVNNMLVRVLNSGRSEYVPDVENSNLRKENIVLSYGKSRSVNVVPLITGEKVIGVIATDSLEVDGVPGETRDALEIFAPQIAIAIENARLYKQLKEQMLELKRSHALLSRAEKLAFLGDLAARLAHEIKNPMTAIGTFIQMLPYKIDDEEYRVNFHKIALEETERVNNLISELLDLVNIRESRFESTNLHELIEKMILLISPKSNAKRIRVERVYDPVIKKVWIDGEKIK